MEDNDVLILGWILGLLIFLVIVVSVIALHWWCTNDEAIKVRHTNIPGVNHCPYWGADKSYIRKVLKNRKCQKN